MEWPVGDWWQRDGGPHTNAAFSTTSTNKSARVGRPLRCVDSHEAATVRRLSPIEFWLISRRSVRLAGMNCFRICFGIIWICQSNWNVQDCLSVVTGMDMIVTTVMSIMSLSSTIMTRIRLWVPIQSKTLCDCWCHGTVWTWEEEGIASFPTIPNEGARGERNGKFMTAVPRKDDKLIAVLDWFISKHLAHLESNSSLWPIRVIYGNYEMPSFMFLSFFNLFFSSPCLMRNECLLVICFFLTFL